MCEGAQSSDEAGPEVGSVEEEAHNLVSAAAAWFGTRGDRRDRDTGATGTGGPGSGHGEASYAEVPPGEQAHDQVRCTGCPWCRAKSAAGPIGAETLDSLADLLAGAAVSLRHFADSRRAGQDDRAGHDETVRDDEKDRDDEEDGS